ncbi:SpoIVB peptidase [Cerasibacillus terrae]|uniref:SpoIVB peptidase n=1 Tax=Cerasibacillus terrae TaxID=2498845 RepID=A0A5C8P341_9BACI|nr:SpoIVB peptidase [Cerasibacillus terrae]TXL67929.1 SpoIVB peptidase [Cerasibacillus terrae]
MKNNIKKVIGFMLLAILFTIPFLTPVQKYLAIPNEITILNQDIPLQLPNLGNTVKVNTKEQSVVEAYDSSNIEMSELESGTEELTYQVAGVPIKKVDVSVLKDKKVIPGGQSIGVELQTKGVLVVGHHLVSTDNGTESPGEDAKIQTGDVILKINKHDIKEMTDVKPIVEKAGKEEQALNVTLKRGNKTMDTTLKPIKDKQSNEYRIGLYIRDSAAGIGTMTFIDPETKKYGALGHVISDMDTKKPVEIHNGTIVRSSVTSIEKGNNGTPGEKQAKFSVKDNKIGTIDKNSPFGIFGKLTKQITNGNYDKPLSIALPHEVKTGPATILTVVEGEKVEEFDVEIVNTTPQKKAATKGMVVKITDPKLLEKTGGIVQGMSGSPIIQNDKIVGAVTHVFVNDPTSGYGVHIEWMLQETGVDLTSEQKAS